MNKKKITITLKGATITISRYPISILLFLLSAILISYNINTGYPDNFTELLLAFVSGAALFMVLQIIYERFSSGYKARLIVAGMAILGAILYYLLVGVIIKEFSTEHVISTMVFLFVLLVAFIWLPSIKSSVRFSESFMVVFKSFFMVVLYSGVLYLGTFLIIMAIDIMIVNLDSEVYAHVATIIAFIYAPIHFLSLIPIYPRCSDKLKGKVSESDERDEDTQRLNKAIEPSKFLEGLISYIIIPVTAIFTVILLLYIVMNITGDFWKDNLMEPLLVTYSITVIIVYLLASVLQSKPAVYFRRIFPKLLIPVVLFQTLSSVLKIGELGITSGRYYVILFGIFATISAIIFSIRPNHKNNVIAPILIILSLISILPPVDAFTISKSNQTKRLINVLEDNKMLEDGEIVPTSNVSDEDKQTIISSVGYLSKMNYLKNISWLREYGRSYNFEKTFGFSQYGSSVKNSESYHFYLTNRAPIDISDYDIFIDVSLYGDNQGQALKTEPWGDKGYTIEQDKKDDIGDIIVKDENQNELIRYSLNEIFDSIRNRESQYGELSMEEASFLSENDKAGLFILVKSLNLNIWENRVSQNIEAHVMVKIK